MKPKPPPLFPFQAQGVAFAESTNFRCLIGDEPGLGKTRQALECIRRHPDKLLPAIVVCPPSTMRETWAKEALRVAPDIPVGFIASNSDDMPKRTWKGILIISWAMVANFSAKIRAHHFSLLIADEAHLAKNIDNAAWADALASITDRVKHAIFLTGTPMVNRTEELHTLLSMLQPKIIPEMEAFEDLADEDPEAFQALLDRVMIRRLFKENMPDIPDKTRHFVEVALPPRLKVVYDKAERDWEQWLNDHLPAIVARQLKRKKVSNRDREAIVDARIRRALEHEALTKAGRLRQIVGEAKAIPALNVAQGLLNKQEHVVIFAEHSAVVELISKEAERRGLRFQVLDGKARSHEERARLIRAFQSPHGRPMIFICSRAGYVGVTLTRARYVVFAERWWTSVEDDQAEGRVYRITQTRPPHMIYMHVPGSIDDKMRTLVEGKRDLIQKLIGATDAQKGKA